jgi:5-methylcytosine-specific restriction enzyme A
MQNNRKCKILYRRQKGICPGCGQWFPIGELTRDHIVPQCRGGGSELPNLQLLCGPCNHRKGDL